MILAIPYQDEKVFQHFGKSEAFKLYETENGEILNGRVVSTNGNGHGALAEMLEQWKVSVLICGGIGAGAKEALTQRNIEIFGGVSGAADQAVKEYLAGTLIYNPDVACNHHHHEEGHSCSGENHSACSH